MKRKASPKLPPGVGMVSPSNMILGAIPSKMMPNFLPPIRVKKAKKGRRSK